MINSSDNSFGLQLSNEVVLENALFYNSVKRFRAKFPQCVIYIKTLCLKKLLLKIVQVCILPIFLDKAMNLTSYFTCYINTFALHMCLHIIIFFKFLIKVSLILL